jgi:hypothetical protein
VPYYLFGERRIRRGDRQSLTRALEGLRRGLVSSHSIGIYVGDQAPDSIMGVVGWPERSRPAAPPDPLAPIDPFAAQGAGEYIAYASLREAERVFAPVATVLLNCYMVVNGHGHAAEASGWLDEAFAAARDVPGASVVRLMRCEQRPAEHALLVECRDAEARETVDEQLARVGPPPAEVECCRRFTGWILHQWERSGQSWDDLSQAERSHGPAD